MDNAVTLFFQKKEENTRKLFVEKKRMSLLLTAVLSLIPLLFGYLDKTILFFPLTASFAVVYYLLYKRPTGYYKIPVQNPFPTEIQIKKV